MVSGFFGAYYLVALGSFQLSCKWTSTTLTVLNSVGWSNLCSGEPPKGTMAKLSFKPSASYARFPQFWASLCRSSQVHKPQNFHRNLGQLCHMGGLELFAWKMWEKFPSYYGLKKGIASWRFSLRSIHWILHLITVVLQFRCWICNFPYPKSNMDPQPHPDVLWCPSQTSLTHRTPCSNRDSPLADTWNRVSI